MELLFKAAAAALTASAAALLIKRANPEISLLLGASTAALIAMAAMGFAKSLRELSDVVCNISGTAAAFTAPVLKCAAVAIVTKLSAELCRDASQGAAAGAVELAGTVCALSIAMPLVMSMLKMIGGMV